MNQCTFANVIENENGILCSQLSFKPTKQKFSFPTPYLSGSQTLVRSESPEVLVEKWYSEAPPLNFDSGGLEWRPGICMLHKHTMTHGPHFEKHRCPFNTQQNIVYCSWLLSKVSS